MNVARTLTAPRRSPRAVAAHFRQMQADQLERLADLYATGAASAGAIAHLAQTIGLRGARITILEREARANVRFG